MQGIDYVKQDDGGPAYPALGPNKWTECPEGMKLLDYAAIEVAAATEAALSGSFGSEHGKRAVWAYDVAAALVAEKRKREG